MKTKGVIIRDSSDEELVHAQLVENGELHLRVFGKNGMGAVSLFGGSIEELRELLLGVQVAPKPAPEVPPVFDALCDFGPTVLHVGGLTMAGNVPVDLGKDTVYVNADTARGVAAALLLRASEAEAFAAKAAKFQ